MAEQGRTVRVTGLPTDIDDDRLKDKLFIHFLRACNGGGEIDDVTIVKATLVSALITFEDSRVAQRIIQVSRHILEVDKKTYELTATEHRESFDPDQVILSLTATVDYSQLPGGVTALTNLRKSHPDVQINYIGSEECCTVRGTFSKVHAALGQLLGQPGGLELVGNRDSAQSASSGSKSVQTARHPQETEDQSRQHNKQREQRGKNLTDKPSDEYKSSSNRDLTSGSYGWEGIGQTDGAAIQLPTTSAEDLSLIVDADMFQYLVKHCRKEYQHILSQYGVEVVDMTNQGVTTLFFQLSTASRGRGEEQECLKLAKKAISRLYQENEAKTRRSQLPKIILSPSGELQKAIQHLSVRYPKLLLNEDDQNICIIGSSSDVSDAKQFLLDHGKVTDKKERAASPRIPVHEPSQSIYFDEERVPFPPSSTLGSSEDRMYQMGAEEDERRAEGVKKYKLAPRFKDTGLSILGSRPTDFTLRPSSSPSRQPRSGPMLGRDVLSDTSGITGEAVSRSQNTGGDILFKTERYSMPSSASMQNKTSLSPDLMDARPKNVASPFSTTQASLSGSTSPAEFGSSLKRASSFSGRPQQKAQVTGQKSQDDSSTSTVRSRGRSSSFSTQTGRDKQEVCSAELTVSSLMWQYIKEAYSTRVEDLISDVQMKESQSEGTREMTLTLRGANPSAVSSCQKGLQRLFDSVSSDFSVQQLRLSELGVTDKADETLQACCSEVQSRFKKVTIQIWKKTLFLLGPQQLCSQVGATLREVFSGNLVQTTEQHHLSSQATSLWNSPTSLQTNEDHKASLHFNRNSQVMLEDQTSKADGSGWTEEWKTTYRKDFGEKEILNGSLSQSLARKDHVIKDKVKTKSTVEMDGQTPEPYVNHSTTGIDLSTKHLNGVAPVTTSTEKERSIHATQIDSVGQKQAEFQNTSEESSSGQGGLGSLCVCGENGAPMTRTKCGTTICSKCLDKVHANCRVCQETERKPSGIKGRMSKSRLQISIPGHSKDGSIKITYSIPDGIQGEGHPSPGSPFQGGIFDAFLPDCEKTRKLLPRLEKAFKQGLTFTVTSKDARAKVVWDCIPHKTSIQGGKSGNGYPDSSYLTRLSQVLTSHGIEESPAKSEQNT
ncbi:uncharacterized protein si:busm1-163l24.3 [Mugil cephalus]|uniref:uncharacterized protein si:busm1-163l24.3 n=1 Tax=Mugil cephalus TaxID=48193 RepID=UPI001FB6C9B5|nr:uncharacterized protein si:busm1-163l24.3 [Mugil cephalus]XP_047426745.1 uncharacterized protein si:busm1-163l24.3 [Mugil cephalus]